MKISRQMPLKYAIYGLICQVKKNHFFILKPLSVKDSRQFIKPVESVTITDLRYEPLKRPIGYLQSLTHHQSSTCLPVMIHQTFHI